MTELNWQLLTWTVWAWMGVTTIYMVWSMRWSMSWVRLNKVWKAESTDQSNDFLALQQGKSVEAHLRWGMESRLDRLAKEQIDVWSAELLLKEAELEQKMELWTQIDQVKING